MSFYQSDLRHIADLIEGGLLLDGFASNALCDVSARNERGERLDNGDDPNAVAWDLRSHIERLIKSPVERLGVMAELWVSAPDALIDRLRETVEPPIDVDRAMRFAWQVVDGCELDADVYDEDWESGDNAGVGSQSALAATLCEGVQRAGAGLAPADVIVGWLRKTANAQFNTRAIAV